MILDENDYNVLYEYAFSKHNPGYNPYVIESPNGDGVWDEHKKYAHIAPKYGIKFGWVSMYFEMAMKHSKYICSELGISEKYWPGPDSTMRLLDYPPNASTAPHTDFDLFTLCLYRNDSSSFKYLSGESDLLLKKARDISPGIHFGELLEEIIGCKPTKHEVIGTPKRQKSIVFFAVPKHESILPSGMSVGKWLNIRKSRSRRDI